MTLCREPGCPFPASAHVQQWTGLGRDGKCDYCWGASRCENWRRCHNAAQYGVLCRVCAWFAAPGQLVHRNRWRTLREATVRLMRDRAMRGVTWTTDVAEGVIVGRQGSFEIRLKVRLWAPTVDDVMKSYGVSAEVAAKWLEPKPEAA